MMWKSVCLHVSDFFNTLFQPVEYNGGMNALFGNQIVSAAFFTVVQVYLVNTSADQILF